MLHRLTYRQNTIDVTGILLQISKRFRFETLLLTLAIETIGDGLVVVKKANMIGFASSPLCTRLLCLTLCLLTRTSIDE